jgi:hypothetical protein
MRKRRRARAPAVRPPARTKEGGSFTKRHFPLILATVAGLTLASGLGAGYLAVLSGSVADFQQTLNSLLGLSAGAIIGLLGGRR